MVSRLRVGGAETAFTVFFKLGFLLSFSTLFTACFRLTGSIATPQVDTITSSSSGIMAKPTPTPTPTPDPCASFAFTAVNNVTDANIAPTNPRIGENATLTLAGTFPAITTFSYSRGAYTGTFSGNGTRFNYTAASGDGTIAGTTIPIAVTASCNGTDITVDGSVTIAAETPRITTLTATGTSGNLYDFTGQISYTGSPTSYQVAAFNHTDVYYYQNLAPIDSGGNFTFTGGFGGNSVFASNGTDRIAFMLVSSTLNASDLQGASYCGTIITGHCRSVADLYATSYTKKGLPFVLDGSNVFDFALSYLEGNSTNADPQIQNLINRFENFTAGTAGAYFVKSYADFDQDYIYDQGLAIIAFSKAGLQSQAQKVLNALQHVQLGDGSWYFSYNYDGSSTYPAAGDRRTAGSIAWVVMGINAYKKAFADTSYDTMAENALSFLESQEQTFSINSNSISAIQFGPTDIGPFDQTNTFSFEHNIDAYSAFYNFGTINSVSADLTIASAIKAFPQASWSTDHFYTGYSTVSPIGFNSTDVYMDTQSWGILALGLTGPNSEDYSQGLTWNCNNFLETAGFVNGSAAVAAGVLDNIMVSGLVGFFDLVEDYSFVWSEGTLGVISAMKIYNTATAGNFKCVLNGRSLGVSDFLASMNSMTGSDGGVLYASYTQNQNFAQSSSVAGTAWLYFVNHSINPYFP